MDFFTHFKSHSIHSAIQNIIHMHISILRLSNNKLCASFCLHNLSTCTSLVGKMFQEHLMLMIISLFAFVLAILGAAATALCTVLYCKKGSHKLKTPSEANAGKGKH